MRSTQQKMFTVALALWACLALTGADDMPASQMPARNRFSSMFDPMVHTGDSELGGRKVNVHVPGLFDLKLDTRINNQGMRMSQSVLGGLVKIYMDRMRDSSTGLSSGPINVKVGGMTMYANKEARSMGETSAITAPVIPSA